MTTNGLDHRWAFAYALSCSIAHSSITTASIGTRWAAPQTQRSGGGDPVWEVAEEERDMIEAKGLTKRRGNILTADRAGLPFDGAFAV